MQQLNIKEAQGRMVLMADVVNRICKNHDIPFYMIGGTMLGAIRHKGFIPWDDDMDFAVPYEHYYSFIAFLEAELPAPYRCVTYEKFSNRQSFFLKIEDTSTIVEDPYFKKNYEEMPGLTIDVFPLVSCSKHVSQTLINRIHRLDLIKSHIFYNGPSKSVFFKFIKIIMPFSALSLNRRMDKLMKRITPGDYRSIPVSPHFWNRIFPKEWFELATDYPFENTVYRGVSDFDSYLSCLYKNYMKLPPKEKQVVHNNNIYIR